MGSKDKKNSKFYFVGKEESEALLSSIEEVEKEVTVVDKVSSKNSDEVSIEDVHTENDSTDESIDEIASEEDSVEVEEDKTSNNDSVEETIDESTNGEDSIEVEEDKTSDNDPVDESREESVSEGESIEVEDDDTSDNDPIDEFIETITSEEKTDEVKDGTSDNDLINESKEEFAEVGEDEISDNDSVEKSIEESTSEKDHVEINKADVSSSLLKNKPYFSFETRIILLLIAALVFIVLSALFVYKTIKYESTETIHYTEKSNINYDVCLKKSTNLQSSCLDEGLQYDPSVVQNISANFGYEVQFNDSVNYHLDYHIVGLLKIFDSSDSTKILYKNEELLLEKSSLIDDSDSAKFDVSVNIDYLKYQKTVQDYNTHNGINANANLEVILFLDEPDEARKVSSMTIPLGSLPFQIGKYNISNLNQSIDVASNRWNQYTISFATFATLFFILSLVLIYRVTRLVIKVTNNRSDYQEKLSKILREYDRIIVVARDGYESNVSKEIIKLNSFDDLLDARDALEKPIIYSKVNSVKSEFIVEDEEKLYKYVLKEADL